MFGEGGKRSWNTPVAKSTAEMLDERGHNDDQTSSAEKELQSNAFNQIAQILLEAGYFRARIATLSEFDKAVGGLCWCITSSGVNVDVDILFTENATIGEKVQLSEKIISVMRSMRCPHPLQANQIQGSDWVNVLPVITWLIMKFFENRELTAKQLRLFAHLQFGKANFSLPHEDRDIQSDTGLTDFMTRYKAMRRFKLTDGSKKKNTEESRVHSALLEYGETLKSRYGLAGNDGGVDSNNDGVASSSNASAISSVITFAGASSNGDDTKNMSAFERKLANAAKKAAAAEAELAKEVAEEEDSLLMGMQSLDESSGGGMASASTKRVGSIVGMGTGEIAAAAARYNESVEETRRHVEGMSDSGSMGQIASYKRQKAALEKRQESLQPQVIELKNERKQYDNALEDVTKTVNEKKSNLEQTKNKLNELNEKETASGMKDELAKLKSLVVLNEQLKGQEVAFKANVKRQLNKLQTELASLESKGSEAAGGGNDVEATRLNEIETMHVKVMNKYDRLRSFLAERNLSISTSSRLIDDIPTRTELIQYERRFTELYQQVALKLDENKKYFEMYNTLDETHRILTKEVTLINSITDNFDLAMKTKPTKEQFLTQLTGIIKSTDDSLNKQKIILKNKDNKLEVLTSQYQSLVDEQRRYFKAVKDFQEECNKNELYSSRLSELTQTAN
mmetsp:Transcript_52863/g.67798  ORF Transcript_52863/g.67798 Transcript_52863/m.67798 type:complete len:681 (-) Transcript_52863:262-2304(-)